MTAAIATATLIDFSVISGDDKQFAIDRNKVRRHRNKIRKLQLQKLDHNDIQALYFDGRKDFTKIYTDSTMKTIKEEHISFVQQPNSFFIGHKSVENGEASTIVAAIESILEEKLILTDSIKAIGCDGTNVNTGERGGVIRKLKIKWNQPVQWNNCEIHSNELPLRALIIKIDGGTKGPYTYSGSIGKRLTGCEEQLTVEFERILFPCPSKLEEIRSIFPTFARLYRSVIFQENWRNDRQELCQCRYGMLQRIESCEYMFQIRNHLAT